MAVDLNDLKIRHEEDKPRRLARALWVSVPLLLLAAGAVLVATGAAGRGVSGSDGVEVEVSAAAMTTGRGPAPLSFMAGGWIEPAFPWPVMVSALTEGRIEALLVQEGDKVVKGAVLALLYSEDFADEARRAEAALKVAQARLSLLEAGYRTEEISQARAVLSELEAAVALASRVYARSKALSADGVVSVEQSERDEAALKVAEAKVEAQKARLSLLESGPRKEEIEEARAELDRNAWQLELARKKLSYVEVRAEAAGTVLKMLAEQGRRVTAEKPFVASLYDPADLWVRVDVAQTDIAAVKVGQEVQVRVAAAPDRTYAAKVVRIDPAADFAKNTITVRVKLSAPDTSLHPDMTARISFPSAEATPAAPGSGRLMIPRVAVVREGGTSFVFEVRDGIARRVEVRLGGTIGDAIEVLEGLSEGSAVAASGHAMLRDGVKVKPKAR